MIPDKHLDIVERMVNDRNGIKATELAALVGAECRDMDLPAVIEELVRRTKIVEIEYILPSMNYRIKSFLLPKNTEVRVR